MPLLIEMFNITLPSNLRSPVTYLLKASLKFTAFDTFSVPEPGSSYLPFPFLVDSLIHKLFIRSRPKQEPCIQPDDADSNLL